MFCNTISPKHRRLQRHHIIPRWLGGKETMTVCCSCHRKLDMAFDSFIKFGVFEAPRYQSKRHCKAKNIFFLTLQPKVYLRHWIEYDEVTKAIYWHKTYWWKDKRKNHKKELKYGNKFNPIQEFPKSHQTIQRKQNNSSRLYV